MTLPHNAPDLRSLDLLATVVRVGSVSWAAQLHHLSQPSASARVRQLERVLGVELLTRTSSGARPTAAGALVTDMADRVLEAVRELVCAVEELRREGGERLRLAASYTIAEYLLPRWLATFHRRHPLVGVELEVGNSAHVAALLRSASADLGFIESPHVPPFLESRDVARDQLVLVVAPAHSWARRRAPLSLRALSKEALVMRERGSGTRDSLEDELSQSGFGHLPDAILELGSTAAVKAAVMDGAGPAVMSRLAVEGDVRAGRLVIVPVADADLQRRLRIVWRPDRPLSLPAVRLLGQLPVPPP